LLNKIKPKSEFSRNVLTLMTGTTVAQAIPIAISPILTRIYAPEDFGVFALYIAIVSFIAVIVTARYEMAIVLPEKDEDAVNILALSLCIMGFIVFFLTISIFLFKDFFLELLNNKDIGNLLYLVPLSVLLAGLNQSFNYWSNRKKYFQNMSNSQIYQSITIGSTQPTFGFIGLNYGLVFGNILGRAVATFILIKKFFQIDKEKLKHIDKEKIIEQLKTHKDFPLINSLHAFSDILRTSGSVILISAFHGSLVLGFYALSLRVLQVPIGIIGSSLGQVLYQKFTEIHNADEKLLEYVKKIVLKLFFIGLPLFVLLYIIAPELFSFVFGEKWRIAGEYSRILTPYLFLNFLLSPLSALPIILNKQKEIFFISLIGNSIFLLVILVFNYLGIIKMLAVISVLMSIYYLYVFYWMYNLLRKRDLKCLI